MSQNYSVQYKTWNAAEDASVAHYDEIHIDNPYCHAKIARQGAQILSFIPKNPIDQSAVLWTSSQENNFISGKAIRGGIPLCFPWFGAHPINKNLPSHGFVRQQLWTFESLKHQTDHDELIFSLVDDEETRKLWNFAFKLELKFKLGQTLALELSIHNRDQVEFNFTFALHSYFAVSDIEQIKIQDLENIAYIDQLQQHQCFKQKEMIQFDQETDRIYSHTHGQVKIMDEGRKSSINLVSHTCPSVVVWNPWSEKTKRLTDMSTQAWREFVCVEFGKIDQPVVLAAGEKISFDLMISTQKI